MDGQTIIPKREFRIPSRIGGRCPRKPGLDRPGSFQTASYKAGAFQSRAFTLLELLIAMGILAVGGAMVAALFPAAIKENTSSYNDTLGSIICENGLATIKAIYEHDPVYDNTNSRALVTTNTTQGSRRCIPIENNYSFYAPQLGGSYETGYLGAIANYPVNESSTNKGFYFMVLPRFVSGTPPRILSDYTFVIIAFQGEAAPPQFVARECNLPMTDDPTDIILVDAEEANGDVGDYTANTLVIIDSLKFGPSTCLQGEYARVKKIQISGGTAALTLDHKLKTLPDSSTQVQLRCWTFQEPNTIRSPAMNVLVARTALRDQ